MKKVNVKAFNQYYKNHTLLENIPDLQNYMIIRNTHFALSEQEIRDRCEVRERGGMVGHGCSMLTGVAEMLVEPTEVNILMNLKLLEATVFKNMLIDIMDGKKLVINHLGGYFPLNDTIEHEIEFLEVKQYTERDIRTFKWFNGSHYYAKIDGIDVSDSRGNMKWNTQIYAYEVAKEYLAKLNKELVEKN